MQHKRGEFKKTFFYNSKEIKEHIAKENKTKNVSLTQTFAIEKYIFLRNITYLQNIKMYILL